MRAKDHSNWAQSEFSRLRETRFQAFVPSNYTAPEQAALIDHCCGEIGHQSFSDDLADYVWPLGRFATLPELANSVLFKVASARETSPRTRWLALRPLAKAASAEVVKLLMNLATDDLPNMRVCAAEALGTDLRSLNHS